MQPGTLTETHTGSYVPEPAGSEAPKKPADYEWPTYGASSSDETTTDGRGWHLLGVFLIALAGFWMLLGSLDGGSITWLLWGLLLLGFAAWSLFATRFWTEYEHLSSASWTILSLPGRVLVLTARFIRALFVSEHGLSDVWWVLILAGLFGECSSSQSAPAAT